MRKSSSWAAVALLCSGLAFDVASARSHPAPCAAACSHQFNASMRAESQTHVTNTQACGSLPGCKAAETTRHDQAVKAIVTGRDACHDQCPNH